MPACFENVILEYSLLKKDMGGLKSPPNGLKAAMLTANRIIVALIYGTLTMESLIALLPRRCHACGPGGRHPPAMSPPT
jgi:hypothetical protein